MTILGTMNILLFILKSTMTTFSDLYNSLLMLCTVIRTMRENI